MRTDVQPLSWTVPGYTIENRLGAGGSGEVWRAHITRGGQPVALKRIPIADALAADSARAEAAALSALDHPHLIRLHELVPVDGAVVLVLDLADGGSLADLLQRRHRLTPGEVITALAPIGAALAYAHGEGVVHGDLSAANVLFTAIGLPLLADLGVARIVGDDRPGQSTPAYIDPAVANGLAAGPPTDVFCLAAVAVHALRGRPLWAGESAEQMVAQAALGQIAAIETLLPDVAPNIRAVIARALVTEPSKRCTAAEFALDLRHSGAPAPIELRAGRAPVPAVASAPERPQFSRPVQAGVGQLTRGTRLAPIPRESLPRRGARWSLPVVRPGWLARRAVWTIALASGLAVLGVAAVLLWPHQGGSASGLRPGVSSSTGPATIARAIQTGATSAAATSTDPHPPATVSTTVSTATVATAASSTPRPLAGLNAATAQSTLIALDRIREQAYATRDAGKLAQVYVSGALREQDAATMARLVRPGCGLVGVRTSYSDVRVQSTGVTDPMVVVRAQLAPSTLICAGAPSGTSAGRSATTLRIELTRHASGYLIATLQIVT